MHLIGNTHEQQSNSRV